MQSLNKGACLAFNYHQKERFVKVKDADAASVFGYDFLADPPGWRKFALSEMKNLKVSHNEIANLIAIPEGA